MCGGQNFVLKYFGVSYLLNIWLFQSENENPVFAKTGWNFQVLNVHVLFYKLLA